MQVKLSAIEIKVHFTILLENCGEDIRLLMNDLSNLLRTKESMARNYSDNAGISGHPEGSTPGQPKGNPRA